MAKVAGPLLSVDASGKVADALVFSRWRGQKYVRQWVKPANPNTAAQQSQRSKLANAVADWTTNTPADLQAGCRDYQSGEPYSGFNWFIKRHIALVKGAADPAYVTAFTLTPASSQVTISWTSDNAYKGKVRYGDKHRVYSDEKEEASAVTSHSLVVDGLTNGVTYYALIESKPGEAFFSIFGEHLLLPA